MPILFPILYEQNPFARLYRRLLVLMCLLSHLVLLRGMLGYRLVSKLEPMEHRKQPVKAVDSMATRQVGSFASTP